MVQKFMLSLSNDSCLHEYISWMLASNLHLCVLHLFFLQELLRWLPRLRYFMKEDALFSLN